MGLTKEDNSTQFPFYYLLVGLSKKAICYEILLWYVVKNCSVEPSVLQLVVLQPSLKARTSFLQTRVLFLIGVSKYPI